MNAAITRESPARRRFLKQLAGTAAVLGFAPGRASWVAASDGPIGTDFDELPPLDGTVLRDEPSLEAAARDYGGLVRRRPTAVLKPGSVRDISRMITFAGRHGLRIAVRGHGHAVYGQTQVDGGLVIDMSTLARVYVADDRALVGTGSSWRGVLERTLKNGLTPPVLPDYLGLSVGGTLSIGGVSPTTYRYGAQVDNVLSLEVVTGEGDIVFCSPARRPDLFEAALAGQGQCAVVVKAELRLVPAPASVRTYALVYADMTMALGDAALLADDGRFDGVMIFVAPLSTGERVHVLVATKYYSSPEDPDQASLLAGLQFVPGSVQIQDTSYFDYANRTVGPFGNGVRPALTLMVPGARAAEFLDGALARLTPDDLGSFTAMQVFVWRGSRFGRPLFRVPDEEVLVAAAVLRGSTDPATTERMVAGNRALYEQARSLGGTLYPFSALKLSPEDWQRHYSTEWRTLARAKRRYDPDNLLASGPDLFGKR